MCLVCRLGRPCACMYRCADTLLKIHVSVIRLHVVWHVIIDVPKMLSTFTDE